jgi:glycosyltransferase involved in cell wall biosynthesis
MCGSGLAAGPEAGGRRTQSLSVCVITRNEEANLGRCLASLSGLADEIVVVDSLSTDRTCDIAAAAGARVFRRPFPGYVAQRTFATEQATGDWVLFIDADEWLDADLRKGIRDLLARGSESVSAAYRLKRRMFYLGRWLRYYDPADWKVRLVRRGTGRWVGCGPHDLHERLAVDGPTARMPGVLCHYPHKDLSDHLLRIDEFTTILARTPPGRARILFGMFLEPGLAFLKRYVLHGAFLDGVPGLVVAFMDAVYFFTRYAKAWAVRCAT